MAVRPCLGQHLGYPLPRGLQRLKPISQFRKSFQKWRYELPGELPSFPAMKVEQMPLRISDWTAKEGLAAGKGATIQEFVASIGDKKLEIDVAPWGEGHLKVNGREIAHIG